MNKLAPEFGAVGTLAQPKRDFSGVGYDEAMRRAREIVPVLRERAEQAEQARALLRENEQLLHETGLFRFHQPKCFGGMELDFVAIVDIVAEIARGCPSTAWNVGNLGAHHWILGFYDPQTQHEVWDANPDALMASSIALAAGRGRRAEGGFIVSGHWPFSSGVDNSEWDMLAVSIFGDDGKTPIDWRLCLVHKSQYEIRDTWFAMGMASTGSKDVVVNELFVPERHALPLARCRGGLEHPGAKLNKGPLYRIAVGAAAPHPLAPAAVGAAEGAYELFVESMSKRTGTFTGARPADFQAVQIKVGKARCLIDSARHLVRQSAHEMDEYAKRDDIPPMDKKLRYRAQACWAVNQAREAIETLWSCYGANGIYTRDPLQRYLRDVLAINQHFSFNFDIAGGTYGLFAMGGKYANPTM